MKMIESARKYVKEVDDVVIRHLLMRYDNSDEGDYRTSTRRVIERLMRETNYVSKSGDWLGKPEFQNINRCSECNQTI